MKKCLTISTSFVSFNSPGSLQKRKITDKRQSVHIAFINVIACLQVKFGSECGREYFLKIGEPMPRMFGRAANRLWRLSGRAMRQSEDTLNYGWNRGCQSSTEFRLITLHSSIELIWSIMIYIVVWLTTPAISLLFEIACVASHGTIMKLQEI